MCDQDMHTCSEQGLERCYDGKSRRKAKDRPTRRDCRSLWFFIHTPASGLSFQVHVSTHDVSLLLFPSCYSTDVAQLQSPQKCYTKTTSGKPRNDLSPHALHPLHLCSPRTLNAYARLTSAHHLVRALRQQVTFSRCLACTRQI